MGFCVNALYSSFDLLWRDKFKLVTPGSGIHSLDMTAQTRQTVRGLPVFIRCGSNLKDIYLRILHMCVITSITLCP